MSNVKKTINFSMKVDQETLDMLREIQEYKEFANTSETVRWLIKRYHKKKIAPQGDVKDSFFHICKVCQHMATRTDPVTGDKIMYCCKCAHDVDKECSSATCGMFDEKEE